jgi:hypothetical protein
MVKIFSLFIFFLVSVYSSGQNGYIKMANRSTRAVGYIKYVTSKTNGEILLEFWKTKKDKSPTRVNRKDVLEYAIKNDTFRIYKNFYPFPSGIFYYEILEAKVVETGRLDLMRIINNANPVNMFIGAVDKGHFQFGRFDFSMHTYFYLIDDHVHELPVVIFPENDLFNLAVKQFFSDETIEQFLRENNRLKYVDLEKLVMLHNKK